MARTLKQDRELAIQLAEKLGHEMGSWRWWFCKRRAICHCKLCGDWAGLHCDREWEYNPDWCHSAGITGPAIIDDYEWRTERCWGIKYRAKERRAWTRRYNKIMKIIKTNKPEKAAQIICGEKE